MIKITSKKKLRDIFEGIREIESCARHLYSVLLRSVEDPVIAGKVEKMSDQKSRHIEMAEELLRILDKYTGMDSVIFPGSRFKIPGIYLLCGAILGLGAPVGAILLRYLTAMPSDFGEWMRIEWSLYSWHYTYMAVGTVLAFSFAAFCAGWIYEILREKSMDLSIAVRMFEKRSERDSLTGLYNFNAIRERITIEMERSRRFGTTMSCLMVDIDNLKDINDDYGHLAGDAVVKSVSDVIRQRIRIIDTASRYGGDEFFIILPVTAREGAATVAERIRKLTEDTGVFYAGKTIYPTVSVGVATFASSARIDLTGLIALADQALYEAKRTGRNIVRTTG